MQPLDINDTGKNIQHPKGKFRNTLVLDRALEDEIKNTINLFDRYVHRHVKTEVSDDDEDEHLTMPSKPSTMTIGTDA